MCSGPAAKCLLLALNVLFVLCGMSLMGIGIWMKVDPMFSHYLHVVDIAASNSLIDWAAWIFIFVGALAFLIAAIGCVGAWKESQCLIFVYILLLFLIMAGEIIAGTSAIVYRKEVEAHLEEKMHEQLQTRYGKHIDEKTYDAWNFLQVSLQCCGSTNYTDYRNSAWWNDTRSSANTSTHAVPAQCCHLENDDYMKPKPVNMDQCQADANSLATDSENLYTMGCYAGLMAWFQQHSTIMAGLGFGIAAVQVLGFIAACSLRKHMRSDIYHNSNK